MHAPKHRSFSPAELVELARDFEKRWRSAAERFKRVGRMEGAKAMLRKAASWAAVAEQASARAGGTVLQS
jgi:hypothetical protein